MSGFASDALAEMVTLLPLTKEPPAGEPTEAVGAVLSTTTTPAPPGCRSMVETLLALSVIRARRWYAPSPGTVVSQLVEYVPETPVESVPIVVHVVPSGEYWKSTEAMPAPESVGVADTVTVPRR